MQLILLLYLTEIINKSLTEGMFIERWKTTIVRPLLKKSGMELIKKNHRPVRNLSFMSKVVERCVLEQFNSHCAEFNLLPDFQSAHRQNYSTETSLLKMVNDLLWHMERKHVAAVAILDFSAAFDKVDHKLLLEGLQKRFGICDMPLLWYEYYLRPCWMKMCINGKYLSSKSLAYSVPQGSCSGITSSLHMSAQ